MVGRSGKTAERFAVPTASPRRRPARMCGCAVVRFAIMSAMRPATRSDTAGAPPLYGTWVASTPAMFVNSAMAR